MEHIGVENYWMQAKPQKCFTGIFPHASYEDLNYTKIALSE